MSPTRRTFLSTLATTSALAAVGCRSNRAKPDKIRVDWAYYSPLSLVLRKKGWLEEELRPDGVPVEWVLSLGSNKALEFLSTGGVDFGSSAGAAALLSRSNGNPIRTVYIFSKPEWTALVVGTTSPIQSVAELKGKKVAATKGTDPYIFLLRILHDAGLGKGDLDIVHLQHPDGRAALERGEVDAWAGLDPHMAVSELEHGSRLIVRNANYNTYGFLSVRQPFLDAYPQYVPRVLKAYERARRFAIENPRELTEIAAGESKISLAVAQRVVGERNDFRTAVPGSEHRDGLARAADILVAENLVKGGVDPKSLIGDLIQDRFAKEVAA